MDQLDHKYHYLLEALLILLKFQSLDLKEIHNHKKQQNKLRNSHKLK